MSFYSLQIAQDVRGALGVPDTLVLAIRREVVVHQSAAHAGEGHYPRKTFAICRRIGENPNMSTSISIHAVGHHLQKEAISAAPDEKEAYARSAFNRYYYSAFLNARSLLVELLDQSKAFEMKHASYPEFLRRNIQKN